MKGIVWDQFVGDGCRGGRNDWRDDLHVSKASARVQANGAPADAGGRWREIP
jgi:hypothetical protein